MIAENIEMDLSEEDVSLIVEDRARKLRAGEASKGEFRDELVSILSSDPTVLVRNGPIRRQGRLTFGQEHEGAYGTGLFILENCSNGNE